MAEQITKYDVKSLNDPEVSAEIIHGVVTQSAALQLFTRLPNMTTNVLRMPVLESLPDAYWVDEDKNNGRKGTTRMAWANKWIYAEELAVIVPIKENLLNDSDYPIWEQVRPRVIEAFHKKIDDAIFTGKNKPKNFPADLLSAVNQVGAFITGTDDLYKDISNAMGKVEESDYNPTGIVGGLGMKKLFRDMLDTSGRPITDTEVNSLTKTFVNNGSWDKDKALYIVGDFTQAVYSIRQDVEVKLLTEGVIQGDDGSIVYNLAQDDMVALRFTMRLGWAIPNPITAEQPDESVRFPFAAVKGSSASGITPSTFTFTVQDSAETEIEGARVSYGGLVKYTGGAGTAEFKVQDNTYPYSVSYNGETVFGEAKASDSTLTVKLTQKKKLKRIPEMSGTTLDKVSIGLQSYNLKQDISVERTGDVIAYSGTVASPTHELLAAAGFDSAVKKVIFTRMWGKPQDFYFYRDGKAKKLISAASWDGTDYIDLILPIGTGNINVEFVDNKTKYKLDVSGVK